MNRLFVIFFFGVLLSGCATNKNFVFDETIPHENQCILEVPELLTVSRFDNSKVRWGIGILGTFDGSGKATVVIPNGEHILTVNYSTPTQSAYGIKVTYNFIAGHMYRIEKNISRGMITLKMEDITK
ncbi:MAG: hypothetical protein Ta2G_04260 [Termitinemataceae bacterium]|nr:MAG: hypothetical protein Ta2G_04260 [Termitinemataceae bacterium]